MSRPDGPTVDDDDLPFVHHPIRYLPWLDTLTEVKMFQLRPTLENRLAEWTGGKVAIENGSHVVLMPGPPPMTARLGDWVAHDGQRFWIESSDDFTLRFWPRGVDPGWSHTCRMSWETP